MFLFQQEQDEPRTTEDKVLGGLNMLRGRLADLVAEQGDLKDDIRGVRKIIREARQDSREHTEVRATNSKL